MQESPESNLVLPQYGAKNFAPLQPLLKLKDTKQLQSNKLCEEIKDRWQHKRDTDKLAWQEVYNAGQLVDLFIQGKQLLRRNSFDGSWVVTRIKQEDSDSQRAVNTCRFYEVYSNAKWLMSNPNIEVLGGRNDPRADASAKSATVIVDHHEHKFYTRKFNLHQGGLALRWGTYIECYRFDSGVGNTVLRDVFGDKMAQMGVGGGRCGDCEYLGSSAADFGYVFPDEGATDVEPPKCPRCGSTSVMIDVPPREMMPTVIGQQQVKTGGIVCEQWPLPACRWDIRTSAEESSWLQYSQRGTLSAIRNLIGPVLVNGETKNYGLDVMEALSTVGMPTSGQSSGGQYKRERYDKAVTLDQFWLSPDDYADIQLQKEEETVSGNALPAGNLAEIFPEGMCVVGLNEMSVVLGVYPECHKKHIVSGVWHANPMSGVGAGLNDLVEVQKRFNHFDSKILAYLDGHATPATLFNQDILTPDRARVLDHPQGAIPVDMSGVDDIRKIVMPLQPGSPAAGVVDYTYNHLTNLAQLTTQALDFTGGMPGVSNKTATGAQITSSNSNALFTPPLAIKADTRMRAAELIVNLYRDNVKIAQKFPLKGKHGRRGAVELAGADISTDLTFEVTKDSEYPTSVFTKKEDVAALLQLVGGGAGWVQVKQTDPELASWLGGVFGIETEDFDYDEIEDLAYRRFEQMQQGNQFGFQDPMQYISLIQPPISLFEPEHEGSAKWWSKQLVTDEGLESPMPLRAAMELVIMEHLNFSTGQASILAAAQGIAQTAGEAPMMAAQGAQQAEQQQMQAGAEQESMAAQNAQAQAETEGQVGQRLLDHELQMEASEADRTHEKETMAAQHKNAKEIEKMKARKAA